MPERSGEEGASMLLGSVAQAAALREANEQLVLATMRAQAAEDELRAAARYKDEFLAMLGHELRNPLVPIRNAAEVLRHVAGDDPRITWVYDVLVRQVGHITRLVDDLLDISLISRGALRLHFEPVDVGPVIRRAVEAVGPLVKRKGHRFHCRIPDVPVWVNGDAIRLAQVFENLLTNAAKYTQDGGEILLTLEIAERSALIRVRDNGLGISAEMQRRIFELFVQDARASDRSEGGLGIGLALVRHLVEMHHGAIEATSEGEGKGTEFLVRLPVMPEAPPRAREVVPLSGPGTGRVMVVDDDVEAGESTALLLRLYGFDVRSATDVTTALAVGEAFRPQVVLMDICMPDADGYEVAQRLSAIPGAGQVTYIAVTGFGEPGNLQRSSQAGFSHHLVKPVDPNELVRLLKQALADHADEGRRPPVA
jgi:two-component system CheB/CheR fusion protein